jgi:sulfate adenylyltransferase
MIRPHGGKLVQRVLADDVRCEMLEKAHALPRLALDEDSLADLEAIASGAFSPLEGFLGREDFRHVLDRMRLSNGLPWTLPIVLGVSKEAAGRLKTGSDVILTDGAGNAAGVLHLADKFEHDREETAHKVFQTTAAIHPGAARVLAGEEILLGGKIDLLQATAGAFDRLKLNPKETRVLFKVKGWRTVAAFPTRAAPLPGGEAALRAALAFVDGILLNPVIAGSASPCADGARQNGGSGDEALVGSWEKILKSGFPPDRAVMAVLRMAPRYAGPREAVLNAIVLKNFGCSHLLIDLDRAGVGDYYHPRAAQDVFEEFPDLGIVPLFFRGSANPGV